MNSLFWVNLLIGCGMLLSGFKQLPVTFSWRKLAVIFLASGSLLLVEGVLVRKVFETAQVLFVIAVLYLLLGLAGLVMMFAKKDRQAFTSEDWRDFAAVLIISALLACSWSLGPLKPGKINRCKSTEPLLSTFYIHFIKNTICVKKEYDFSKE